MRRFFAVLVFLLPVLAWGPKGHQAIVQYALWNLPEGELKAFLLAMEKELKLASLGPDQRRNEPGEAARHFFEVEAYGGWPLLGFPMSEEEARARFGEEVLEHSGRLLWAVADSYRALVEAFKSGERAAVLRAAGDLAHYVGDLHQPLHLSRDYDGQSWLNGGIHALFENTLLEAYFIEAADYRPRPARVVSEGALALATAAAREGYPLVRTLNEELWKTKRLYSEFDRRYYETLWRGLFGEIARVQLRRAGGRLASLYLTAWREAR